MSPAMYGEGSIKYILCRPRISSDALLKRRIPSKRGQVNHKVINPALHHRRETSRPVPLLGTIPFPRLAGGGHVGSDSLKGGRRGVRLLGGGLGKV